jgi:hypothetical protein
LQYRGLSEFQLRLLSAERSVVVVWFFDDRESPEQRLKGTTSILRTRGRDRREEEGGAV